jgi:mitofusin
LAQDFSVLKLDLKLVDARQTDLVHSLDKANLAKFLNEQISKSIRHLLSLRDRIEDTSSKVLVTGDLNAGKSTFCNALLRRKVLPEDQQPCTSIFCEVLDFRENGSIEEVHAIPIGQIYKRDDESTYHVFALEDLEKIVVDNEHFSQCKVYIKDIRSVDESLLNNGVVDIALIDAPGLNSDSLKTTAIFARQEEIDVVVFVVSAANYFTLSAKEFIFNAAREKAYMFMVVNGFDNIRDKRRCQEQILKQVLQLSPATFKESSELVHFVSSNAIPVMPAGGEEVGLGGGGGGSGSGSGVPGDDGNGDDDDDEGRKHEGSPVQKGKGKEKEKVEDFTDLEASLRRFVLEKRARSKLAPAKTYLLNLLGDLDSLADVNVRVAQEELGRVADEMQSVDEEYNESSKVRTELSEQTDHILDQTVTEVYDHTRSSLNQTITRVADQDLGVPYEGLLSAFQYAQDVKLAMLQEITNTVELCEQHARTQTTKGVNSIKTMGLRSLQGAYTDLNFRPDKMFKRRKDALVRQVDVEVEVSDFIDFMSLWERQEKVAGTSMAITVAGVMGTRLIGGVSWVDSALGAAKIVGSQNLRRLILPGILAAAILGVSYALASIPRSLPRRLSAKLANELAKVDYTHTNAKRISDEVRRALRYPADDLRECLRTRVTELKDRRLEKERLINESEGAKKYFSGLLREAAEIRAGVERVDLEGPTPGVAAAATGY